MLKSIDDNWVAVYNTLSEKGAERLMDVNRSTLKMLVGLLEFLSWIQIHSAYLYHLHIYA